MVLGTSCRLLEELLRVLWGALGVVGKARGDPPEVLGGHWASLDRFKGNFKMVENPMVLIVFSDIPAILSESLGQL